MREVQMKCALIGEKLGHSFSKEIHERLGRYEYRLIELSPDELGPFLDARDFDGLNVTIPYKQAVIPYLDELSTEAKLAGAVNTIVNRNGRLTGHNTDIGGMKMLVEKAGIDPAGKTVIIAGSGGTSRTAECVAADMGAAEIFRLSRTGRNGAVTYEKAYKQLKDAQILINTTPAGMYPDIHTAAVDLDHFDCIEGVIDVVYNPLTTRLVREARAKGIPAENGLYMLVAQAMLSAELFTDSPVENETTDNIYRDLSACKRNINLVGMPGSGKSTLGRILAEKLGRELIETDDEIVRMAGMPISEIFRQYGENYFRDIESKVILQASMHGGRVISTGGGAVLRSINNDAMKMNGTVVFLDRPVSSLIPTDDRPLADDRDKILRLYKERYPLYTAVADIIIKVCGTEEEAAEEIRRALY